MRLKAWIDSRISVGPSSRRGSMFSPRPSLSALAASCLRGKVARRNSQIIRPITRLATSSRLRVVCQDQLTASLSTRELNCSQPPLGSWMEP
ncbi:hypothetical protein D3C74_468840 [compost metagenome]